MFRHSSSLFVSIVFHSLLLVAIFYSYKQLSSVSQTKQKEKRVCISLSCIPHAADEKHKPNPPLIKKTKPPKKTQQKKVTKKIKRVEKQKKAPAPIVEELIVVKETKEKLLEPQIPHIEEKSETDREELLVKTELTKQDTKQQEQVKESPQEAYMNEHLAKIVKLLQENLYYPRSARKRGIEGEVVVKFKLLKNAEVNSIKIISSEHKILSRGAMQTIEALSKKFPKPNENLELSVPINYSLRR